MRIIGRQLDRRPIRECPARPPCCGGRPSVHLVTKTVMTELPASDTHDVSYHGGAVVSVVLPIGEYQRQRRAAEKQRVDEELDAART
jgi:hypothetical protein